MNDVEIATLSVDSESTCIELGTLSVDSESICIELGTPCITIEMPDYEGAYEVTPCAEAQPLATANRAMREDLIINPIPSNYGLITWNGQVLTVS